MCCRESITRSKWGSTCDSELKNRKESDREGLAISPSGSAGPLLSFFPLPLLAWAAESWKEVDCLLLQTEPGVGLQMGLERPMKPGIGPAMNLLPYQCVLTEKQIVIYCTHRWPLRFVCDVTAACLILGLMWAGSCRWMVTCIHWSSALTPGGANNIYLK